MFSLKKLITYFKLAHESGTQIEQRISKAYAQGVDDATKNLQKSLAQAQKRVSVLTNELIEQERKFRTLYQKQITEYDAYLKNKCNKCQAITNEERIYLRNMQQLLASQLKKIEYIFIRIHEYLDGVKSAHHEIMLNAGKVNATDYIISTIEKELKTLIQNSEQLLLTEIVEKEFINKTSIKDLLENKTKKEGGA